MWCFKEEIGSNKKKTITMIMIDLVSDNYSIKLDGSLNIKMTIIGLICGKYESYLVAFMGFSNYIF